MLLASPPQITSFKRGSFALRPRPRDLGVGDAGGVTRAVVVGDL